jgi:putative membrane protein
VLLPKEAKETMETTQPTPHATRTRNINSTPGNTRAAILAIVAISVAASLFLFWLVYVHQAPAAFAHKLSFLPALNAVFNGLSAVALTTGLFFILNKRIMAHRNAMMTAFVFSSLFLVSYITNHALHGDQLFPGHGTVRTIYLWILVTHIFLSVFALPLVLVTFFFSLSGRFAQHKKIARWTFPIWLYVSVTGVIVGTMLMMHWL